MRRGGAVAPVRFRRFLDLSPSFLFASSSGAPDPVQMHLRVPVLIASLDFAVPSAYPHVPLKVVIGGSENFYSKELGTWCKTIRTFWLLSSDSRGNCRACHSKLCADQPI